MTTSNVQFKLGDKVYYEFKPFIIDQMGGDQVTGLRNEHFKVGGYFKGQIFPDNERTASISKVFAEQFGRFQQFRFANIPDIKNLLTTYWQEVLAEDDAFPFKKELALKNIDAMVQWLTTVNEFQMFGIRLARA